MSEPRRLLETAVSPLARQLLEAGLSETPNPAARARTWRACAGEGLASASTFDGNARSFSGTLTRTLNLVRLPGWMRRSSVFVGGAALGLACAFSIWFLQGGSEEPASHHASEGASVKLGEKELLDRAEALLLEGDVKGARKALALYRLHYADGASSKRAELLELQAKALAGDSSMDTP